MAAVEPVPLFADLSRPAPQPSFTGRPPRLGGLANLSRSLLRARWARSLVAATLVAAGAVATAHVGPAAGASAPVTVTFKAAADARVEQKHPTANYGSAALGIEADTNAVVNSYLKFTTTGLVDPVTSAKLRLRVSSNGSPDIAALHTTGTGWTEKGLTWKNAPARGSLLGQSGTLTANTWIEFDVTPAVTGNGTFAFVLSKPSGTDGASLNSREQSNAPQLVVTTATTTTTTTSSTTTTSTSTTTTTVPPATTTTTAPPTTTSTTTLPPTTTSSTTTTTVPPTTTSSTTTTPVPPTTTSSSTTTTTVPPTTTTSSTTTTTTVPPTTTSTSTTTTTTLPPTTTSTSTTTTTVPASTTSTTTAPANSGPLAQIPTGTNWRAGSAFGGGYMNFVEFHPTDPQRVLLVTDIGGILLSTDGGTTWTPRGRQVSDQVAGAAWNPARTNVAYALAGSGTSGSGGVMVSTDGGVTWTMSSTVPTGFSNNTPAADGLPTPHPRSTGQLLAVDAPGGFLYAGTYKQGLMRAPLDASGKPGAWTTVALAPTGGKPYFIRGIALDDADPTVVYVATYPSPAGSGTGLVYRISGAGGSAPVVRALSGGPRQAEEVRVLGGNLYAVANDPTGAGVGAFRLAGAAAADPATPWRRIAAGPSVTTVTYYGMEITKRAGTTTLWVTSDGAYQPAKNAAWAFLWRGTSDDDFATDGAWTALPGTGATRNDIAGPNNPTQPWWAITGNTYGWPGVDSGYTASAIAISPSDPNTVIMAGQGGPWRSTDNGATWYPVPTGVDILVHSRVTTDPGEPDTVALGTVDYRGFTSDDGLRTGNYIGLALKQAGLPGAAGEGWSVAYDQGAPGPSRPLYVGTGDRGTNTLGQVWMDPDPSTTTGWVNLMDTDVSGGRRPIGLTVVRDPAAPTVPVTIVVLQNGQMLRKIGSDPGTAWVPATNFTSPLASNTWPEAVEFIWKPGMDKIYAYDRVTGLWRSDDFGFTWTLLSTSPDKGTNKQGFISGDPTNEDIVYLSTSAGVSVIANAGTAGAGAAVLTSLPLPAGTGPAGPLAVGNDGRIYVTTQPSGSRPARIFGNRIVPAGGVALAWYDLSDDLWANAVQDTREMAVGGNGALYIGLSGGVFVLDSPAIPTG